MSAACNSRDLFGGLCGEAAVETAVVGCIHEHVKPIASCEQHVIQEDFGANCWECWDGPDSHGCRLAVRDVRGAA